MKKQIDTKIDLLQKLDTDIPYIDILFEDVENLFFEYEKYVNDWQVDLFIWLVRDLYLRLREYRIL